MVTRIIKGGGAGEDFMFRASMPGVDAWTAPPGQNNYQLHEKMRPMAAEKFGMVTVPAGGSIDVDIGTEFAKNPPQVLLNADDGEAMGTYVHASYFLATGILTIYNDATVVKNVRYAVLIDY